MDMNTHTDRAAATDRALHWTVLVATAVATVLLLTAVFDIWPFRPLASTATAMLLFAAAATLEVSRRSDWRPHRIHHRWAGLVTGLGILGTLLALSGLGQAWPIPMFIFGLGALTVGTTWMILARYSDVPEGVDNHGVMTNPTMNRGAAGWMLGILMTGFYVLVYWYPSALDGLVRTTDWLSWAIRGKAADHWFMYSLVYTLAVAVFGIRAWYKYRHVKYQRLRTLSVVFVQLILAFVIPSILVLFQQPEFYFSYFWPLKWTYLWPGDYGMGWILADSGRLGMFMIGWGIIMSFVATPILTYFYGKRWYCSWVCGCGAMAETMGDSYRHLAPRSTRSWQLERWMVHGSLLVIVVATAVVWINSATQGALLGSLSGAFAQTYGFLFGAIWAGVIGVGFYPFLGTRIWCRYGCPMAAILGLQQRFFSRFRITTNGGQCISCGNCSAYCEMGIDVRWYAQRGQNIVRASCVGCGICSSVCPRGVLKLENGPTDGRLGRAVLVEWEDVDILSGYD
jgi:Pyruvate/2-oxoacid:ferredoxin oxidoreductase delta subunit